MAEQRSTSLPRNRKPGCLKSSHSIAKTSLEIKYTHPKIPLNEEWLLLNSLTDNSKEISNETPSLKQVPETPFQSCVILEKTAILIFLRVLFLLFVGPTHTSHDLLSANRPSGMRYHFARPSFCIPPNGALEGLPSHRRRLNHSSGHWDRQTDKQRDRQLM